MVEPKTEEVIEDLPEPGGSENRGTAPREGVQRVQVTLDPEITKTSSANGSRTTGASRRN